MTTYHYHLLPSISQQSIISDATQHYHQLCHSDTWQFESISPGLQCSYNTVINFKLGRHLIPLGYISKSRHDVSQVESEVAHMPNCPDQG